MKGKYISTQSNELLSCFNGQNKTCFDYSEAFNVMPEWKESTLRELLSDMTKRGLLMRLKDGVYSSVMSTCNLKRINALNYDHSRIKTYLAKSPQLNCRE